ncbi:hypothetical protein [uncultured Gammaproteobacteria bacterium]|nr:hypothetical protein [uncultured Gammaproteobacteria bacterium]CAC9541775.1 hypothetical protein [uncultured Gammaproteobacteria bacterium]CAC9551761.1 hypothetical protein [uncultured Gammaproteobacteria bacterium]
MSDPLTTIYKSDYKRMLKVFTKTLPYAYKGYTEITSIQQNSTILLDIQTNFARCIKFYSEEIFIATSYKINVYLRDFSVTPKGSIDEFKIIFFLAKTLSVFLERDGLKTASKIVLSTMIGLLDEKLTLVNAKRPKLTEQTINLIQDGTLFKKTGEVGLYLTYKCLYKYAEENQKNP